MRRILSTLAFLSLFVPTLAFSDGPLRAIVIFGNEKTDRDTILSLIKVPERTYVDSKLLQEVDDRLVNSGLFKTVRVSHVDNRDGTADLRVVVVEKQLWFIVPTFQSWSGRYSGGLVFGESNYLMQGARTAFLVQGGNKFNRIFLAWDVRNLWQTNFALRTYVLGRQDRVPIFDDMTKLNEIRLDDAAISIAPGYEWTREIRTNMDIKYRYVDYGSSVLVPDANTNGSDVSITFEFVYDSLNRREAFLEGIKLETKYEFADTRFGTDYKYAMQRVEWKHAMHILRYLNYVYTLEGSIGDRLPFHREFTLGGASLRGYSDRQFRGDTLVASQHNILFSLFNHRKFAVFGDVFFDTGLLYRDANGLERENWRNGTGGGFKVSLKDILAPVFGFDVGYGLEDKKLRYYFAIGLVDF